MIQRSTNYSVREPGTYSLYAQSRIAQWLFFLTLLLIAPVAWGQQLPLIMENKAASATSNWTFTNGGGAAIQQNGYWLIDHTNDIIISDVINVSGFTDLVLTFDVGTYGSGGSNPAIVEYSTNGGSTWSSPSSSFTSATPSSSTYISSGEFKLGTLNTTTLKFRWKWGGTSGRGVRIDNIELRGMPAPSVTSPTLTLPTVADITTNSATLGATISDKGGEDPTASGVVYIASATAADPAATDNPILTAPTVVTGKYSVAVSGLSSNTVYQYRGFASNSAGTGFSSTGTFTTVADAPVTTNATSVNNAGFVANWTAPSGTGTITEYFIDIATDDSFSNKVVDNASAGNTANFVAANLQANTTYYYRVRAVNAGGTSANSNILTVTTTASAARPSVSNISVTNISAFAATLGAEVLTDGGDAVTDRGFVYGTIAGNTTNPTSVSGTTGVYSANISSLVANTTYYYRAFATNSVGTNYSAEGSFRTATEAPVATAATDVDITAFTANWNTVAGAVSYTLEVSASNTFATILQSFPNLTSTSQPVSSLAASTAYHYRIKAKNADGLESDYSNTISVTTKVQPVAVTVHYWHFNNGGGSWSSPIAASVGDGFIDYSSLSTDNFAGTTLNTENGIADGQSFVLVGSNGKRESFFLNVPTSGFKDIELSYATRGTSSGYTKHTISYSTDGNNYIDFDSITGRNNTSYSVQSFNFSNITAANNNPDFKVRITVSGGSSGNNRFDNMKIRGFVVDGPEINVKQTNNIAHNAGTYTFGEVVKGQTGAPVTFTIENKGTQDLTVGAVSVSGAHAAEFTVDQSAVAPLVAAGGATTFTVAFAPADFGTRTATISIVNSDSDENPYTFTLTGTGANPQPVATALLPDTAVAGQAGFVLTVSGADFVNGATVRWNGSNRTTRFINATTLEADITAADVAAQGTAAVTVLNPAPLGGTSSALTFTINPNPDPEILVSADLTLFSGSTGSASASQTFQVEGQKLKQSLKVTAPANFEVSSDDVTFSDFIVLAPVAGAVAQQHVYVRYKPTAAGSHSGTISIESQDAVTRTVTVAGKALSAEPTAQAAIAVSQTNMNDVVLTLTPGNGTQMLVLARMNAPVSATPADGQTYTANTAFGTGEQIGSGNYVVYKGSGTTINVTGLSDGSQYHFAVFTYNDENIAGAENYLLPAATASTTTVAAPTSAGVLVFEENFEYQDGTNIKDNNWAAFSSSGNGPAKVVLNSLSYNGYGSSGMGNAVMLTSTGAEDVTRMFDAITPDKSVYVALLVNVASVAKEDYFFSLTPGNQNTSYHTRLIVKNGSTPGKVQFGASVNSATAGNNVTAELDINTTHLIVMRYDFTSGGKQELYLWVNPSLISEPKTADVIFKISTGGPANIGRVALRQDNIANVTIDGIRVGTGWGAVVGNPMYFNGAATINAGNYNNITLKDNASEVTLNGNVNIYGQLDLSNGILKTSQTNLLTIMPGGSIAGANTNSFINGPVRKRGNSAFIFPIGGFDKNNNPVYAPLGISAPANATAAFRAEYKFSESPNKANIDSAAMHHVSEVEHWDLTRETGVAGDDDVFVTLHWFDGVRSGIRNLDDLLLVHYNSATSKWENIGGSVSGSLAQGSITSSVKLSSFSPFSFGSTSGLNPLPVELVSFKATAQQQQVQLHWSTASELNSDYFVVERAASDMVFKPIATLNAAGSSRSLRHYEATDFNPVAGTGYYRLKQVDTDGTVTYSQVVAVQMKKQAQPLVLYPNPVARELHVVFEVEDAVSIEVLNILGQVVRAQQLPATTSGTTVDVSELPAGTYQLILTTSQSRTIQKFIKTSK